MSFPVADAERDATACRPSKFSEQWRAVSRQQATVIEKELTEVLINFVTNTNRTKKIASEAQLDDILLQIEEIVSLLPGTLTVQKVLDIDSDCYSELIEQPYRDFLDCLLSYFDDNFPFRGDTLYESVKNLLCVENDRLFLLNIKALVKILPKKSEGKITELLQIVLESDGLFSFIVYHIIDKKSSFIGFDQDESFNIWKDFVNVLVSLPSRISNILEGIVPNFFSIRYYTNFLLLTFLKIVEFLSEFLSHEAEIEKLIDYSKLSLLLSKIVTDFNDNANSESIKCFIEIIALLTNSKCSKISLYQNILRKILFKLDRSAVNTFAKMLLLNVDPNKYLITNILGKDLIKNENWKFVLCTKIPLLTNFSGNYTNLMLNLTIYLSSSNHFLLLKLFTELLTVWADKSAINRTSIEQRLFITEFMLYIFNSMQNISLSDREFENIKEKVYSGIVVHLESNIDKIRSTGMKFGEIILNYLTKEGNNDADAVLKFDYDTLNEECKIIVNSLQKIWDTDIQVYYKEKTDFDTKLNDVIMKLKDREDKIISYIPPERKFRCKKTLQEPKNEITLSQLKTNSRIKIIDSTDLHLDSDDDLEPYDVSNDIPTTSKKNPPMYLRDLRDGLIETEDCDIFRLSLENCENLITAQLHDDDASIGLEILEILLSIEPKFYVENFDDLVFQSAVAVTTVYPSYYAEYLCKQIHADIGIFSISKRVFMLNVLRQTAKNLSVIKTEKNTDKKRSKKQIELDTAEEVIRKRLEAKTRYFHKYKQVKNEQINRFSEFAGYFFFPLLYGYNQNKMLNQCTQTDSDFVFLIHFIETLAIIMCASQNCPVAPRMAKEIFHFSWFLRFHKEVKVRMAVLSLIACAIMNVPKSILLRDFTNELLEIRLWLSDLLSPNVAKGEPNLECRDLAGCTIVLIEGILKEETDVDD